MYRSLLFLHWKQVRWALVLSVVGAFALPLLMVSGMGGAVAGDARGTAAYRLLESMNEWLYFFPTLAGVIGMTLALTSWNWDHQYNHVYALSLPLSRWEYTLNKLLAGFTLTLIPAAGLWLGAHVASASVDLPSGLHAYPNQLGFRFLLALMISYSLLFAMAAGTKSTAIKVLGGGLAAVFLGTIANDMLAQYYDFFGRNQVIEIAMTWLATAPGPFEVFSGNWSLFDV